MQGDEEHDERHDRAAWKRFRTGSKSDYNSIKRDTRGYPLFVKATHVSKDWDQFREEVASSQQECDSSSKVEGENILSYAKESQRSKPGTLSNTSDVIVDTERGKRVASFYSQLPREAVAYDEESILQTTRLLHSLPRRERTVNKNDAHWFIRKASARLKKDEADKRMVNQEANGVDSQGRCRICSATLSISISTVQWNAHRSSIAHQLAADGPLAERTLHSIRTTAKEKDAQMKITTGEIILRPSNPGYTALERMGWRKGMGLGKDEWDYGLKLSERTENNRARAAAEAIVISDSEDEDDLRFEIGSEQWLARINLEEVSLASSLPSALHVEENEVSQSSEEEAAVRIRPLLEPIAVQLRPDRRGIGKKLSVSSRFIDSKTLKQVKANSETEQKEKRLTKSQMRQRERQKQEEWKQLRQSLN